MGKTVKLCFALGKCVFLGMYKEGNESRVLMLTTSKVWEGKNNKNEFDIVLFLFFSS